MVHKLERRPELDALRGLFLVWMTLTHLPTRFSDFVNQPLGFISSAEGFVFISALLVGGIFSNKLKGKYKQEFEKFINGLSDTIEFIKTGKEPFRPEENHDYNNAEPQRSSKRNSSDLTFEDLSSGQ